MNFRISILSHVASGAFVVLSGLSFMTGHTIAGIYGMLAAIYFILLATYLRKYGK